MKNSRGLVHTSIFQKFRQYEVLLVRTKFLQVLPQYDSCPIWWLTLCHQRIGLARLQMWRMSLKLSGTDRLIKKLMIYPIIARHKDRVVRGMYARH